LIQTRIIQMDINTQGISKEYQQEGKQIEVRAHFKRLKENLMEGIFNKDVSLKMLENPRNLLMKNLELEKHFTQQGGKIINNI